LASGRGAGVGGTVGAVTTAATVIVVITEVGALPDAATTGADKDFRDAEVSVVGTVAVIPVEADAALVADAHLTVVDIAMEAETHFMAVDVALAGGGTPLAAVAAASEVAADMAPMEAEGGMAVAMVVGTGDLHF